MGTFHPGGPIAQALNFIFDLDGTLANDAHRQHLVNQKPAKWDEYNQGCVHDLPIRATVALTKILGYANHLEIWTGRTDDMLEATEQWLKRHGVTYAVLRMREAGDFRKAEDVKGEWLRHTGGRFTPQNTVVFDDRAGAVRWWRSMGFTCLDVAGHQY